MDAPQSQNSAAHRQRSREDNALRRLHPPSVKASKKSHNRKGSASNALHFNHYLQPATGASAVPSLKKTHSRRTSANSKKKVARPSPAGHPRPPGATASAGSSTTASVCHTARASCAFGATDLRSPGTGSRPLLAKPHHERVRSLCSMNIAEAIEKAPSSRGTKQSAR